VFKPFLAATGKVIVAGYHTGGDKAHITQCGVSGYISVGFDFALSAYGTVTFNAGTSANDGTLSYRNPLSHGSKVGCKDFVTQFASTVNDCAGTDDAVRADVAGRQIGFFGNRRVGGFHGAFADTGEIIDPYTVADDRIIVNDYMMSDDTTLTDGDVFTDDTILPDFGGGMNVIAHILRPFRSFTSTKLWYKPPYYTNICSFCQLFSMGIRLQVIPTFSLVFVRNCCRFLERENQSG
jgi:hypothetical protein